MHTWLHIGAGSFHRAHQAWYLNQLRQQGKTDWSIALANIRDDSIPMMEKLAAQHCEYTLETVDSANNRQYERISSITSVVPWEKDLRSLIDRGADSATKIISFTVTEGGYYFDTNHRLDMHNPDIQADLAGQKTTIYGTIAALLRERSRRGGGPVTLLSCDNVRHNGRIFRQGLMEFFELTGETALKTWVEANTSCPCCMVDRITPRPTPDIAQRVLEKTGFVDAVPVMAESFIQWVVEDRFAVGRPPLESAGVEMVDDVQPYEEAKIRILNSTHAVIAWAGTMAGMQYIHESTAVPAIRALAESYVTEDVIPCLTPSPLDLALYRDTVLDRYLNANIRDTNQRVAADGFSKIPAMIVPTLAERYASGHAPEAAAMLPAVFFVYLRWWADNALPYEYQDGVMDPEQVRKLYSAPDPLAVYASVSALFGTLAGKSEFVELLRKSVYATEELVATKFGL